MRPSADNDGTIEGRRREPFRRGSSPAFTSRPELTIILVLLGGGG
jgi:hypothetical protein